MKNIYLAFMALVCGGLFMSCEHKNLVDDGTETPEIKILFDWGNAPDANPASVVAYLFPESDVNSPLRYNFSGKTGGKANVPGGRYVGIGMNSDNTDWARFRNTNDSELFEVYTSDLSNLTTLGLDTRSIPRAPESESERMAEAVADKMWTDRQDNISVDPFRQNQVITFYPEEITCHYTVTINDIKNINYLQGANLDATLSGLSESYLVGQKVTSSTPVTMPVVLRQIDGKNSVFGSFLNFGNTYNRSHRNYLTVYLIYENHTGSYATFDVTDQVRNAPDPRNVNIVVNGLDLPYPIASGSGFVPNVNEWNSVDYNLEM